MRLEFLASPQDKKILRTTLYSDQEFTSWELELLHTPVMQRLYNLKQLGFADRVFPDAVHSRLNHILGVTEMAERMAKRLLGWLEKNGAVSFEYAEETVSSARPEWPVKTITGVELAAKLRERLPVVRLIGFLHDLTHAAFGHTLEDEVCVFTEKHDDIPRQQRFFDALVAQLFYLWAVELGARSPDPAVLDAIANLEVDPKLTRQCAEEVQALLGAPERQLLAGLLGQLEAALVLLNHVEFMHGSEQELVPQRPPLMVTEAIKILAPGAESTDVVLHRDAFMVDIVANTICADLLDYARRDPINAGLRVQFDDRVMRYLCAVSVREKHSPTGKPCIRLAVQFFTDKMRHDVLSEMSGILKARYLINERILFHPTKCAAGAMLGTAVQLLGVSALPNWMQVLGDQEFLRVLVDLGQRLEERFADRSTTSPRTRDRMQDLVEDCFNRLGETDPPQDGVERIRGARVLLWRLMSRRYAKTVFRLRAGFMHSGGENDESLADRYIVPAARFALERQVEQACCLPPGTVVIHCPRRKMSMKVAQALVVGSDLGKVAHLREVEKVTPEPLGPYHDEIAAVEQMYKSIWQFHVFLDSSHHHKRALVEKVLEDILGFPNDELLHKKRPVSLDSENPFELLAGPLCDDVARNRLATVVRRLDQESAIRMRHGSGAESALERVKRVIGEVEASHAGSSSSNAAPSAGGQSRAADGEAKAMDAVADDSTQGAPSSNGGAESRQLPMFKNPSASPK